MKIYSWTVFFSCTLILAACDKDPGCSPIPENGYMVFGHFYGECWGEGCVEIFKLENGKLYEDTLDRYPSTDGPYEGAYVELPASSYESVRDILGAFPEELLAEPEHVIGQPDAGDWGGIYVEIITSGDIEPPMHRFWLLDQMDSNMPAVYNVFVDKINEKIAVIHQ